MKLQGDLFDSSNLKQASREERKKFPPVSDAEQKVLDKIWRQCRLEATFSNRPIDLYPPYAIRVDGIAARAARASQSTNRVKPDCNPPPGDDPAARAHWAGYRKCAACPGPHRRRGQIPFGHSPETEGRKYPADPNRGHIRLKDGSRHDTETGNILP
jgi:hypothetical protein